MTQNQQSNTKYDYLEHRLHLLQTRFWVVAALFVGLGLLNVAFLVAIQFNLFKPNGGQTVVSQLDIKPIIKKDYQVSIKTFYNNAAVSEVAYQLDLKRQSISSNGTSNCFTPIVPPIQNGCSFVLRPYASGITSKGSYLNKLIFNAQMGSEDKIVIDVRDIDKNEIISNVGAIVGKSADRAIALPSQLGSKEQLYIRFWPVRGSVITINEVLVEYFSFDQLQPVALTLPQAYPGSVLTIYQDYDNNKKLDTSIDKAWSCNNGFSGVKQVTLSSEKTLSLMRDDTCVLKDAPAGWATDKGLSAIAPYTWLAVVEKDGVRQAVFPFEVTKDKNIIELVSP